MLNGYFIPQLIRRMLQRINLKQARPLAHYVCQVGKFSYKQFLQQWLERAGPFHWGARSSDLTPTDFFLYKRVKTKLYARKLQSFQELKYFIEDEAVKIPEHICENAFYLWSFTSLYWCPWSLHWKLLNFINIPLI